MCVKKTFKACSNLCRSGKLKRSSSPLQGLSIARIYSWHLPQAQLTLVLDPGQQHHSDSLAPEQQHSGPGRLYLPQCHQPVMSRYTPSRASGIGRMLVRVRYIGPSTSDNGCKLVARGVSRAFPLMYWTLEKSK